MTPKPANRGHRPRIDWAAARAFYVGLDPADRVYATVAAQFGISDVAVGKHARAEGWAAAAAEADRRAADAALQQAMRGRDQHAIRTVRIRDAAAVRLQRRLEPDDNGHLVELDDVFVLRSFEIADRMARLDAGEATGRVEIGEVQVTITALLRALSPFIAEGSRHDALAAVDLVVGGIAQLGTGEAA